MNKTQKHGTESEILAEYFLINRGYIVSKPINDFNEYDFIIDNKGCLYTIQVKTIYYDNSKNRWLGSCVTSHIRGNGRRTNKKYSEQSFDFGLFVCKEHNVVYFIPIKEIAGRRSITFYPDGKPKNIYSRYEDFEKYKETLL